MHACRSTLEDPRPDQFAVVNNTLYFAATNGSDGAELWSTNGTTAGEVTDLNQGAIGSFPKQLVNVNNTLFFTADDGTHGSELFAKGASVQLLKDIRSGSVGSNPTELTNVGGTLFFTASDGTHGAELWKSDGTTGGTSLVTDLLPGAVGSDPRGLTAVGSTLFFTATDVHGDRELYKSDGTSAGTVLVRDLFTGASSNPDQLTVLDSALFFTTYTDLDGRELWRTDGTSAGTVLVKQIAPATDSSDPQPLFVFGGSLYFGADDASHGSELWLVKSGSAPTSSGLTSIHVSENATPSVANLFSAFADDVDADSALTYSISANSNAGLFASTTIDPATGSLTLTYQTDVSGSADLTVRATDTIGQSVETTLSVLVDPALRKVTSPLTPTSTGFVVEFDHSIDPSTLNLSGTEIQGSLAAPDLTLVGATTGAVHGSLIVDSSGRKITFVPQCEIPVSLSA